MFYHIRAFIKTTDSTELQGYIDTFTKRMQQQKKLAFVKKFEYTFYDEEGITTLFVQAWLDMSLVNERLDIFTRLKQFVTSKSGTVDWHECHNDENQPCTIVETYTVS